MADLPLRLDSGLAERLTRALDVEGKIPRALEALGPIVGRDVAVVVDPGVVRSPTTAIASHRARELADRRARVVEVDLGVAGGDAPPEATVDAVVAYWSAFRPDDPGRLDLDLAAAGRILRPGGRLLVIHDYGRDDVSGLLGERPEYGTWSRRDGPLVGRGFRIRVVHCWWTFDDLEDARSFLVGAFGDAGSVVADRLTRPRLSYNVAIYHRTSGDAAA